MDAREHRGPDERPRGHAEERERADDAERPGPGVALEEMRGRGRADRHEDPASEPLDEPRGDEQVERGRRPGQPGADRERREAGEEEPANPPQVGEAAGEGHRHDVHEQVAVDDPGRVPELRDVGEVAEDRRQGDRRDHQLESGEECPGSEHDEEQGRLAARPRA